MYLQVSPFSPSFMCLRAGFHVLKPDRFFWGNSDVSCQLLPQNLPSELVSEAIMAYRALLHNFEWENLPWEDVSVRLASFLSQEIAQSADGTEFAPEESGKAFPTGHSWNLALERSSGP